ncbi:MAG: DUF4177 domain-containing protein [Planctomycetota bacterium]
MQLQSPEHAQTTETKFEYKIVIYREPLLGSVLLQGSKVDPVKYSEFLNRNAAEGWRVKALERELRRELLFFKREAFVTVLERELPRVA